mmetsp:Transcript_52504/g.91676  ORF Transcript_52504/g.91676 Transcript_52504/m.91676 type:complete len:86 (+) Transcript_52504:46-303(+)
MSRRGSHIWLSLREMRIAKMDRKPRIKPCSGEFDMFLKAQSYAGAEHDVPFDIAQALEDCMEDAANAPKPIPLKSHLKRFVKYTN